MVKCKVKGCGKQMRWSVIVILSIVIIAVLYLLIQAIRCQSALPKGKKRLTAYDTKTVSLSYGDMTYVDCGQGEVILSVHGIFGGYDQAFDTCRDFVSHYRILAPSRFGYPGSDILGDGTPAEQAAAYVELLDRLEIDKVYVLATSAGGSIAFRFALDYPERTKGLILYCSAMPYPSKPHKYAEYAGPPELMCNDYAMFLLSPLFEPIMGMKVSTISDLLPVGQRKAGILLDAAVVNPDMARNYDSYPIEELQMPILILHAKDDKLADYDAVSKALFRFPDDTTLVSFETGGHLMTGNGEMVKQSVTQFIEGSLQSFVK